MPSTAQIQADRDAYAAAHPYVSALAGITGGSMPFLATGGAADELGLLGRGAAMAGTGAVAGGLPSAVRGDDASAVAGSALSAPSSERAEKSLAPRSQARQASWLTPFSTETWWLPRQASLSLPRMRDTMRRGRETLRSSRPPPSRTWRTTLSTRWATRGCIQVVKELSRSCGGLRTPAVRRSASPLAVSKKPGKASAISSVATPARPRRRRYRLPNQNPMLLRLIRHLER